MALPFTRRELTNAWRDLGKAARPNGHQRCPTNAHRLLLFYAVECGLKAVLLKDSQKTVFHKDDVKHGHDLLGLQTQLRLASTLLLPSSIQVRGIRIGGKEEPRNGGLSVLHEVGSTTYPSSTKEKFRKYSIVITTLIYFSAVLCSVSNPPWPIVPLPTQGCTG